MFDSLLRAVCVGFAVNKLATKEVYIKVLRFSPLSIIPPYSYIPSTGGWTIGPSEAELPQRLCIAPPQFNNEKMLGQSTLCKFYSA
jgi:hypothetical protein